jgi:hypothetical protein
MANRIVFLPNKENNEELYIEKLVDFEWVPGISNFQSLKSIKNLHRAIGSKLGISPVLEVSTKSDEIIGIQLSAFNLLSAYEKSTAPLESIYHASKVFQFGGPYKDLVNSTALESKKDGRLKSSGKLINYLHNGVNWPIKPSPNFYDYLYISALLEFPDRHQLQIYAGFTDIAYSQTSLKLSNKRSFNCQARSVAIYVSLLNRMDENQMLDFLFKECTKMFTKRNQYFQELLD